MQARRLIAALLAATLPWSGASAACLGMQVHAHRGAPALPENSLASIRAAYAGAWDGVEIDMQRLKDGNWVLHHDLLTGRTVGGVGRKAVLQLSSAQWRDATLTGPGGGTPPPFLDDALRVAAAQPAKTFNAELKVVYRDCAPVSKLVAGMTAALPHGNWMITSAFADALRCVRGTDRQGYLGLIVFDPRHAESLGGNPLGGTPLGKYVSQRATAPKLTRQWLADLAAKVGAPVGVHVDALTLAANPRLLRDAAAQSVRVFVYAVGGDAALAQQLRATKQREGYLPSGVIIDGDAQAFCRAVGG
ncbi:glycerophosphodiester phosphodiesterase [Achromobacter spanius]|uniref:glycerophosphodiester phosphodiesterase n=1 Tax=Achromobacter spanius TaxID=217203 RepID=UPI0032098F12